MHVGSAAVSEAGEDVLYDRIYPKREIVPCP